MVDGYAALIPPGMIPESVAPLVPLFAPYCGGVGRLMPLEGALATLLAGDWTGKRLLQGGGATCCG